MGGFWEAVSTVSIELGVFVAFLLLLTAAAYRGFRFELHMFQQNSYRLLRMWRWHRRNLKKYIVNALLLALAIASCFTVSRTRYAYVALFGVSSLVIWLFYQRGGRGAIKPLVWTARVKRLGAAMLLVSAMVGAALFYLLPHTVVWWLWAAYSVCAAATLAPLVLYLAAASCAPVERAIANRYVNDAKRILSKMPELTTIGVTGSFGKSSVKHYIAALLAETSDTLATPESYNTTMGVVRTIRENLRPTHRLFVCEMGARQSGDIAEICDLVRPKLGVITALGEQHLETFKSVSNIVKTKYELARALPCDGVLFLNYDCGLIRENAPFEACAEHPRIVTYGTSADCDYRTHNIRVSRFGTDFSFATPHGDFEFSMPLVGAPSVQNVAGALAVAFWLGCDAETLARRLRRLECVPHRLQILDKGGFVVLDDAYNSNPTGFKAALDTLALFEGTKILITPGMVELGPRESDLNREAGAQAAAVCDHIILVGEERTRPIRQGALSAGFEASRLHTAARFVDAYALAQTLGVSPTILIENDLPDSLQ